MMRGEAGPKIVQIETRYVQTDADNFKDVVQSFTGKNSSTDWIMEGRFANIAAAAAAAGGEARGSTTAVKPEELEASKTNHVANETSLVLPSMQIINNNMFVGDLDRLLLELPDLPPIEMEETIPWL
ncbi:uncharacterized protein LOC130726875 [Lotus japonicus]|uniref:uncharacterized protein LOC130726875 n=1 Tax=Lotus japonicus TaxID=34305 RepID=UPI00258F7D38|nr:uncharacterized protein LOC130726875 [Lotus japonicus]